MNDCNVPKCSNAKLTKKILERGLEQQHRYFLFDANSVANKTEIYHIENALKMHFLENNSFTHMNSTR